MARIAAKAREAHFEARREQILQAALGLFSSRGFEATTVDDIAQAAGVAKGSLYLYFPTKMALLEGLIHRYSLLPDLPEIIEQIKELAPPQGISLFVAEVWRRLKERKTLARVVVREIHSHPVRGKLFSQHVGLRANELLAAYLERWIARGALRPVDPVVAAQSLFGMLWAFLLTQELMGAAEFRPLSDRQIVEAITDLFLNGAGSGGRPPLPPRN